MNLIEEYIENNKYSITIDRDKYILVEVMKESSDRRKGEVVVCKSNSVTDIIYYSPIDFNIYKNILVVESLLSKVIEYSMVKPINWYRYEELVKFRNLKGSINLWT
jgi:hypothetical protein